jgi:hypothetical protein
MMLQVSDVMPVSTELPALISTSAMSVAIIQWLKNTKYIPFMDQHSAGINRVVGWCSALASSAGIHYSYDAHVGTLTLTGLTAMAIFHAATDATKSYAFNWLIYNGLVKGRAADVAAVAERQAQGMPVKVAATPGVVAAAAEPEANKGV